MRYSENENEIKIIYPCLTWGPAALTCSSDVSNDVKSILVNGSSQREGDEGPAALLVIHSEHQATEVCPGFPVQLQKSPL